MALSATRNSGPRAARTRSASSSVPFNSFIVVSRLLLSRNDCQVGKIAVRPIPDPAAHQSPLLGAQLVDDEARFARTVDEDAHLRARDDDTGTEPPVGIRDGFHRLLILSRVIGPQLLPWIRR